MSSAATPLRALSPWHEAWRVFKRNQAALIGLTMLVIVIGVTLFGPMIYKIPPMDIAGLPFIEPFTDTKVLLGTDYLGRDVLAGVINGGRATLTVGISAAFISVTIGLTLGALAGYFGGWIDDVLTRIIEFFQVLPALLFAMVLVTLFSPKLSTVTFAIGAVSWAAIARLTRAEFMRLRRMEYVNAARAMGAGHLRLMLREILPNALPPLIVSATLIIGVAILFEGGLSFLGLSDPNVISWGLMIGNNRKNILECWWAVTFPGMAIFFTVLAVSLVGDGLNDALNPKLHQR
jgi:peptide/nickel transport system permease protein